MGLQATVIRDILYAATSYGEAYDTLREMAGFTPEEISDSSQMVEWEKAAALNDMLADITGNEQIGLVLGMDIGIGMTGMVGFLMQASKNIEEALNVYCLHGYLVCPMIAFRYKKEGDFSVIELHQNAMWKSTYPRNARIAIDFTLGCLVNYMKVLTGRYIYPRAVELEFPKIAVDKYTEILHCQVSFSAPLHRIVYDAKDMEAPILSSDISLFETFSDILGQRKTLPLQSNCRDAVKNLLLMQFKGQIPTIEEVAEELGITVRTLQRKLSEEQTSFRSIAAEVRKELALHLMKNPKTSITEVAGVLGYGDLPAFRRAFKTWTQTTPKAVKKQLRQEESLQLI